MQYLYLTLWIIGGQMLSYIAQEIMKMLDYQDLVSAQQVSPLWRHIAVDNKLWKKLLDRLVCFNLSNYSN